MRFSKPVVSPDKVTEKKSNHSICISLIEIFFMNSLVENPCNNCPHLCSAFRNEGLTGFCNTNSKIVVARVCVHHGEEPVINGKNGICNVFFYHCNMQCIYCQNHQISYNDTIIGNSSIEDVCNQIKNILKSGVTLLGFVSPSHCISQMLDIIQKLNSEGYFPKIVYNSNAYDSVETLQIIQPFIDIYLPDFKYSDNKLALELSGVKDYSDIAINALKEMYRQKGTLLLINEDGIAESGLIVRHLVLPGYVENSVNVLRILADEFPCALHISLMSQYYPVAKVLNHKNLSRLLNADEYNGVVDEMEQLGFYKGWVQELKSSKNYRPDFDKEIPFE